VCFILHVTFIPCTWLHDKTDNPKRLPLAILQKKKKSESPTIKEATTLAFFDQKKSVLLPQLLFCEGIANKTQEKQKVGIICIHTSELNLSYNSSLSGSVWMSHTNTVSMIASYTHFSLSCT
jgi:hypothetical protein